MLRIATIPMLVVAGFLAAGCGRKENPKTPASAAPAARSLEELKKMPPPKEGPAADATRDALKELATAEEGLSQGAELARKEARENLAQFGQAMRNNDLQMAADCLAPIEKNLKVLPDSLVMKYKDAKASLDAARTRAGK